MDSLIAQAKERVRSWTGAHAHVVIYREEDATLVDLGSGKSLHLPWPEVVAFEEKVHRETQDTYLVLMFENGTQIALVDPGAVAFAPSTRNTGTVEELPPVVCLSDFHKLKQRVDHFLYSHREEPPPRECATLITTCIAILDGARAIGFEVGDLETELENSLGELERRMGRTIE